MSNIASKTEGAQVISATASEERHPAANVIDGNEKTFWYTTGMYPQELVINFGKEVNASVVQIITRHVRQFTVLKCDKPEAKNWDDVWKSGEIDKNQDSLQTSRRNVGLKNIRFLKLRIENGYEEFAAVYEVRVEGSAS